MLLLSTPLQSLHSAVKIKKYGVAFAVAIARQKGLHLPLIVLMEKIEMASCA